MWMGKCPRWPVGSIIPTPATTGTAGISSGGVQRDVSREALTCASCGYRSRALPGPEKRNFKTRASGPQVSDAQPTESSRAVTGGLCFVDPRHYVMLTGGQDGLDPHSVARRGVITRRHSPRMRSDRRDDPSSNSLARPGAFCRTFHEVEHELPSRASPILDRSGTEPSSHGNACVVASHYVGSAEIL